MRLVLCFPGCDFFFQAAGTFCIHISRRLVMLGSDAVLEHGQSRFLQIATGTPDIARLSAEKMFPTHG